MIKVIFDLGPRPFMSIKSLSRGIKTTGCSDSGLFLARTVSMAVLRGSLLVPMTN